MGVDWSDERDTACDRVSDGDNSSPDAALETGGTKSK